MKLYIITCFITLVFPCISFGQLKPATDTLEVQIGASSKIIFLGHTEQDWDEIANYDLNKLFEEIRLQHQIGLKDNTISAHQAEKILVKENLINRRLFGRLFYFNFHLGFTGAKNNLLLGQPGEFFYPSNQHKVTYQVYHEIDPRNTLSFSLSLNTDFTLIEDKRKLLALKSGLSYTYFNMEFNQPLNSGITFLSTFDPSFPNYGGFLDSLHIVHRAETIVDKYKRHILAIQVIPIYYFFDRKGSRSFQLGFGASAGLELSSLPNFRIGIPMLHFNQFQNIVSYKALRFQPAFHFLFG